MFTRVPQSGSCPCLDPGRLWLCPGLGPRAWCLRGAWAPSVPQMCPACLQRLPKAGSPGKLSPPLPASVFSTPLWLLAQAGQPTCSLGLWGHWPAPHMGGSCLHCCQEFCSSGWPFLQACCLVSQHPSSGPGAPLRWQMRPASCTGGPPNHQTQPGGRCPLMGSILSITPPPCYPWGRRATRR